MKKVLLFLMASVIFYANVEAQNAEYKTLYSNTFLVMDKIIYSDIDLDRINDLKFLQSELKMTDEEVNSITQSIKSAGSSLMSSQNISEESCHNCDNISGEKVIETFKFLRSNKDEYEAYKTHFKETWDIENRAGGGGKCDSYACFAACCAVCAYTIPSFPIYCCCAYICYHDCCSKKVNPGDSGRDNSNSNSH
jgi:hypothetical protein